MKVVVLDSYCVQPGDLDWSPLYQLADQVELYPRTNRQQLIERLQDADYAISNKCNINQEVLQHCPNLRWVGLTSTGTDSLDLAACKEHGVSVANVPGYSTFSVAQHTFALLLEITNGTARRYASLKDGYWQTDVPAQYGICPHKELYGLTFGIVGFGEIGQAAARIAQGFGMRVLVHTRTIRPEYQGFGVEFVEFEQLLAQSDVVSLHCPATPQTRGMIGEQQLKAMKPQAILLNTARGSLVDEAAVAQALQNGQLFWYGTDVVCHEPIAKDNPLLQCEHALITPHVAWATTQALTRLAKEVCENLRAFQQGNARNIVNG